MTESSHPRAVRQPFELWVRRELKRSYDKALDEALPADLLDLLSQADETKRR